jgi:glyoxylase-like metal-dependent hydrolase (beta-lactamase superfamily II)
MMEAAGIRPADLNFVLITHGHEDHDGGLAELVASTHLRVKAHAIYELLIRRYPSAAPAGFKESFPAKCWHCPMPESFWSKNCLGYHRVLQDLDVAAINDGENLLAPNIRSLHLPGHSPDCLAVSLGNEALVVGDIVLPDISPWPTREEMFAEVAAIIQSRYPDPEKIFGLQCYIKSLKQLADIGKRHPGLLVLPAHRMYYDGRWNGIQLVDRALQLVQHHIERCAAIISILSDGPKTAAEIAREHFDERLLEGFGSLMATNEIISHCELLIKAGDVTAVDGLKYVVTGNKNFEIYIKELNPDS